MSTEKKPFPTPRTDSQRENPHNVALENSMLEYHGKPTVDEVVPATLSEELEQECAMLKQQAEALAKALEQIGLMARRTNIETFKRVTEMEKLAYEALNAYRSTKGSTS